MSNQTQHNPFIIGIDVSKNKLDIHCLSSNESSKINNELKTIKHWVKAIKIQHPCAFIIMESTGGHEQILPKTIYNAGIAVHIAHTNRLHYFAKQKGYFAKTDKIDAKTIAQYADQEKVEPSELPSKNMVQLKELTSRRAQLIKLKTMEKNRLRVHLDKLTLRSIKRGIKFHEQEIERLDTAIQKLIDEDQNLSVKTSCLITCKGVGKNTANTLVALLPELGQLNRNEIAGLVGVAPKNKDSGIKMGKRNIAGGRFYVRKALFMAALSASRSNPPMRAFYLTLKSKGKPAKMAIIAVARKLIITLNAMLRDNKNWVSSDTTVLA